MTKLNCTARQCVNNEGGLCGAEYIMIQEPDSNTSEQTFCSNFRMDTVGNQIGALANTDFIGEIFQMLSSDSEIKMSPIVTCHAKNCFFNGDGKCEARAISILGDNANNENDTRCETFIE